MEICFANVALQRTVNIDPGVNKFCAMNKKGQGEAAKQKIISIFLKSINGL